LIRQGALADAMNKLSAARASREDRRFTKVLHLHVSVSRNGNAAAAILPRHGHQRSDPRASPKTETTAVARPRGNLGGDTERSSPKQNRRRNGRSDQPPSY